MPTDPRNDRKHPQGSPKKKHHSTQKSGEQHSKKHAADSSYSQKSHHHSEHRDGSTAVKHEKRRDGAYAAEYSRAKSGSEQHGSTHRVPKQAARDAAAACYAQPKKKKKFKFKRFFKKLGREIQAFAKKLVEVQDVPEEQMAITSATPKSKAGYQKKKPDSGQQFLAKAKQVLLAALRAAARGIYLGVRATYQFLMRQSRRTLLIGSSAFGLILITVIILAIALPGKSAKGESADQLAAFTALDSETTALDSISDGMSADGTTEDGTVVTGLDTTSTAQEQADAALADTAAQAQFSKELKSGDNDPVITQLQTRLMELGYMDSDEPTQHFGPLTQSALKAFQRHNGLGEDGIVGQETYNLLMSDTAKVYVMQLGDSGPDVEGVQQRLYELGYLDNKANIQGNFGEKTETAVKAFQKKNDLKTDGKVGSKTIDMLYGEDVVSNAYTLGDENKVILDCQTALKKLGYITFKPDGVMGRATVSAIKAFQQANGLTRDGALGPVTRDMILSGDAQSMVLQIGDYGTGVKNMQNRLVKLNYLASRNATGYFGEITEDAVKAFQKRAGLTADGKVGAVTLTMMNSSSAKKAASAPSSSKESSSSSSSSSGSSSGSSSSSSGSSSSVSNKTGVEKLVALAESKLGSKYVRGAKGPNTFDCSGFVYWCLKNAGVSTSYMTSIMWRTTSRYERVTSMSSIQRGDILVFSGETDSSGHVGIYIGNGKMYDASSSEGKVRLSSSVLNSGGYWTRHFICAYRVF